MNLVVFNYKCAKCSYSFEAPTLPGEIYGELILRSVNDKMAYLMALNSLEFKQANKILKNNSKLSELSDSKRAEVFHHIFGSICDLAPDGTKYRIGQFPACPNCQSTEMAVWGASEPYQVVDEKIDIITFGKWNSLTTYEQEKFIDDLCAEYLAEGKSF